MSKKTKTEEPASAELIDKSKLADQATSDIFLWANQTDAVKNELTLELFVFSKNYTPYSINFSKELETQLRAIFLFDVINAINFGAGTGLSVRDFELSEAEENVLLRTDKENVGRAETLIHLIENERDNIVQFSETEHEFKRMLGMILKCTRPDGSVFYIAKAIQQSTVLNGQVSWEISHGSFTKFQSEVGVKPATDNQTVIIGDNIFIFNQRKFEKLFKYDHKQQLIADKKAEEILKHYKLSFPEGLNLQTLIKEKPGVVKKLQRLSVGDISQERLIDYADEVQLDLMTDDNQAIIIMDGRDLDTFVSLLNEDYYVSSVTGKRYQSKNKKHLEDYEQTRLV